MILSFKKFDNLLLSLKVGVNFMNSQHLRLKWHFEKLDKYGPRSSMMQGHILSMHKQYLSQFLREQCLFKSAHLVLCESEGNPLAHAISEE